MPGRSTPTLEFSPRLVRNVLLTCVGLLFVLDLTIAVLHYGFDHQRVLGFAVLLNSDVERSIPTLFNVELLFLAGLVCAFTAWIGAPRRRTWWMLAGLFVFLGADESLSFHEMLVRPVRELLDVSGFFFYAWIIPYGVACAVLAILLIPWLRGLPRPTRRGFLGSAALYGMGVFVMESISGAFRGSDAAKQTTFTFELMTGFEECFEMLGLTLFIYFGLVYAMSLYEGIRILPRRT